MRAGVVSLIAGVAIMGAKLVAWLITGSSAIFADAAESIVNIAAAALATYTVAVSARPPDEDHPYGHGKAESISAAVEGTLIVAAAAAIVIHSAGEIARGPELRSLGLGMLVAGAAGLANLVLGLYLIRTGRASGSPAIVADGQHVLTDVVTTAGSLGGLVAVQLTGLVMLDPLVAFLVAANVLRTGWRVVRGALRSLLDEADFALLERIAAGLRERREPEWVEVHQLRAWSSGPRLHIDVHLTVPRYYTVAQGHRIADGFEEMLHQIVEGLEEPVVHLDPCIPAQCSACSVSECPVRSQPLDVPFSIDAESITLPGTV